MKPALLLALLLTLAAPAAFAKNPKEPKTKTLKDEEAFKALDQDGDNLLSKEEFCAKAAAPADGNTPRKGRANPNTGEDFEKLDADKDGRLTLEEFSHREATPAGQENNRKKRKAQQ